MDIPQIIQALVTIISSGGILLILREQIKSQQEQISSMKSNIESMKSFVDIFKVDEVKKFVEIAKSNAKAEAIEEHKDKIVEMATKELQDNRLIREIIVDNLKENKSIDKHTELVMDISFRLIKIPREEREKVIKSNYPKNENEINAFIKIIEDSYYTEFQDNDKMSLKNLNEIPQTLIQNLDIENK
jgi:hypothetical protein